MKIALLMILCGTVVLWSGCAAGIKRTGYQMPPGQTSKTLPRRPIALQCDVHYQTNDVEILGSIQAYDTGLSTDCDEAVVLDTFCREGMFLGADVINITQEKQPNPWTSTCYRAKAEFLRFKDREKSRDLVSDAKYAPEEIAKRVAVTHKREKEVITGVVVGGAAGGVIGGVVAGAIVSAATAPDRHSNTNSVPAKASKKP